MDQSLAAKIQKVLEKNDKIRMKELRKFIKKEPALNGKFKLYGKGRTKVAILKDLKKWFLSENDAKQSDHENCEEEEREKEDKEKIRKEVGKLLVRKRPNSATLKEYRELINKYETLDIIKGETKSEIIKSLVFWLNNGVNFFYGTDGDYFKDRKLSTAELKKKGIELIKHFRYTSCNINVTSLPEFVALGIDREIAQNMIELRRVYGSFENWQQIEHELPTFNRNMFKTTKIGNVCVDSIYVDYLGNLNMDQMVSFQQIEMDEIMNNFGGMVPDKRQHIDADKLGDAETNYIFSDDEDVVISNNTDMDVGIRYMRIMGATTNGCDPRTKQSVPNRNGNVVMICSFRRSKYDGKYYSRGHGSGCLIDNTRILTCAHLFVEWQKGKDFKIKQRKHPDAYHVFSSDKQWIGLIKNAYIPSEYFKSYDTYNTTKGNDFAIAELHEPFASKYVYPVLSMPPTVRSKDKVKSYVRCDGFPKLVTAEIRNGFTHSNGKSELMIQLYGTHGRITKSGDLMKSLQSTTFCSGGQSGAPVFKTHNKGDYVLTDDDRPIIIGIHVNCGGEQIGDSLCHTPIKCKFIAYIEDTTQKKVDIIKGTKTEWRLREYRKKKQKVNMKPIECQVECKYDGDDDDSDDDIDMK